MNSEEQEHKSVRVWHGSDQLMPPSMKNLGGWEVVSGGRISWHFSQSWCTHRPQRQIWQGHELVPGKICQHACLSARTRHDRQ